MTTKEKAIIYFKDLRKRFCEDYLLGIPKNTAAYKATMAEKEFYDIAIEALEQTRWIPVSERLPEANRAVLTYIDTGAFKTYCLAYWNDVRKAWEEWIGFELIEKDRGYKVLAWQPLPELYKAESEE